jgi:glycosyltransferase involved in cell wall biosynthesis
MAEMLDVQLETTTADASFSGISPRVRTAIAVIMTHFPRIDETFILREINEMERNGQPVVVVPLVRVFPRVVHEEAKPWMKRALFTPLLNRSIVASNLRSFFRDPRRYLGILLTIVLRTIWRPSTLVRSVALFPKAVHLAQVLPTLGVQHVHAHFATHSATVAWILSSINDTITYSFTVHGPDVFVNRLFLREKIERAKFVRCTSTFNKAFLAGLYPLLTEGKLQVVHTGVNPDIYAEASRAAGKKGTTLHLLSIAALTPSRGFPVLIDACARLIQAGFDLQCSIVGDGPLRLVTEQWIARHGLSRQVRLLGALPQHEVARLMGEADIFVFPSIIAVDGQMDGIPISLMEAMAAGRPVVGSAISGIPELVRHEVNGLLVDAAYPQRMEAAIRRLVEDPALRERLGKAGRETVQKRFDVRRTTQSLIALLDRTREVNQPAQSTKDRIRELNWKRMNVVAVGVRRIHDRPQSYVAEVTISDGVAKQDVIVRQHCGPTPEAAQERARHEFEVLSTLRQSIPEDTGWTMPRLLMFDEPSAALVVERADGKSLAGILAEGGARVAQALRRTALWLRFLQEKTSGTQEDRRHLVSGVVFLALQDLELAGAADRLLVRHRQRIADRLRALEGPVAELPHHVTGHHGNFIPENIFIGSRRVDVVDFSNYREGLPLEDVAEMLLHLQLRGTSGHRRAFTEAYGRDLNPQALELFTLTRALHWLARRGVTRAERTKLRKIILRSLG